MKRIFTGGAPGPDAARTHTPPVATPRPLPAPHRSYPLPSPPANLPPLEKVWGGAETITPQPEGQQRLAERKDRLPGSSPYRAECWDSPRRDETIRTFGALGRTLHPV